MINSLLLFTLILKILKFYFNNFWTAIIAQYIFGKIFLINIFLVKYIFGKTYFW